MGVKAPTETVLVKAVLDYLRFVRRWPAWRNNTGAVRVGRRLIRFGEVGAADVLGILPAGRYPLLDPTTAGRLLAVEVKRPGNRPTPAQLAWLDMVREAGAVALVVHSLDELAGLLAEAGYP